MGKCNECGIKAAVHPTLRLCYKCFNNPMAKPAGHSEKWWLR